MHYRLRMYFLPIPTVTHNAIYRLQLLHVIYYTLYKWINLHWSHPKIHGFPSSIIGPAVFRRRLFVNVKVFLEGISYPVCRLHVKRAVRRVTVSRRSAEGTQATYVLQE